MLFVQDAFFLKTVKQLPIYFLGRIFPAGVAFVGISIYAHLLDPSSFGAYAILISVSFLVGMTGFSWLRNAVLRMLATISAEEEPDFLATCIVSFTCTALVVVLVLVGVLRLYNAGLSLSMVALTAVSAVASSWFELNITVAQAKGRLSILSGLQIARSLASLGATLVFIKMGYREGGLLGGFVVGNLVSIGSAGFWSAAVRGRYRRGVFSRLFGFGWPSSVAALNNISPTFMRYMLEVTGSMAVVGIYSAASDFAGQTVSLLIGTASLAGQPLAFRARDRGTYEDLMTQLRANASIIFVIGLGATVGLITLAGPIAHVYFGSKFQAYSGSLIPFVLTLAAVGVLFSGLRGVYFEQAFEIAYVTWPLAVIMVARTISTVALGFFAVRSYGIVGAAITVLFTDIWSSGLSFVWGRRFVVMPIPVQNFMKTCFASAVISVVLFLMPNRDTIFGLSASILVGVLVYGVILALCFDRQLAVIQTFLRRVRELRGRLTRP